MERGVIYVATGEGFRSLAEASARSLRAVEPGLAIDLFTDAPKSAPEELFDRVYEIARPHARSKLDCMAKTRFERTLYLDCDTLVIAPLGDMFDLLERFEMAVAHDMRRDTDLIREGLDEATPYAFPQMNSGVFLFRRSPEVIAFLEDWARRFKAANVARDQIILKDMLWRTDLRFYVLPPEFNLRRVTMLDAWEPGDVRPTILHSHRFKDHLDGNGARIGDAETLLEAERDALEREWREAGALSRYPKPPARR